MKHKKISTNLGQIIITIFAISACTQQIDTTNNQTNIAVTEDTEITTSAENNASQNVPLETENHIDEILTASKSIVIAEDDESVTILDAREREVTIQKNPQRVILLQNSILDLWYLAGGTAIARVSGTTSVPEEALDLPEIGKTGSPNIELLLAAEPDLIVLNSITNAHIELEPILEENGIPYFYTGTSVYPYENILKSLYIFTRLTGKKDTYQQNIVEIVTQVNAITETAKKMEPPTVLILFGSSKSIRVELENGLVGEMVNLLGAQNVVDSPLIENATKIDFSLETIVAANPDYVLVVTMGNIEDVQTRIAEDLEGNEAWASLTAVQNNNVYYLPSDLFLYKPNERYPEAFQILYDILYP